jgi:hypothetical protein
MCDTDNAPCYGDYLALISNEVDQIPLISVQHGVGILRVVADEIALVNEQCIYIILIILINVCHYETPFFLFTGGRKARL